MKIPKLDIKRMGYLVVAAVSLVVTVAALASLASQPGSYPAVQKLVARYTASQPADEQASAPAAGERGGRPSPRGGGDPQAQRIAARNVFSPPAKDGKPPTPVAIMGDQALFPENQWAKVGDDVKGFKLATIGPDWVELASGGRTQKMFVFSSEGGGMAGPSTGGPGDMSGAMGRRGGGDRGGDNGFGGRMRGADRMMERLRDMPPEQREAILQRMPPEMRQRLEAAQAQPQQ